MRAKDSYAGAVVLISGAASGIGRSLTLEWLERGAKVAMLDVDAKGLQKLASALPVETTLAIECDVRCVESCQNAVDRVLQRWGKIDLLANNAGVSHHSPFRDTELSVLSRVMDINFFGAVHLTHAALPALLAARGRIVVLSSVAGFAPLIDRSGYAASKHALHGFFDSLRAELRESGVSVTLVCPGFTDTSIDVNAMSGDGGTLRTKKKTVGKVLQPSEVARAIVEASLRRRDQILISKLAKASYWLSRLARPVYEQVMRRSV